jgi:hypothetical protein
MLPEETGTKSSEMRGRWGSSSRENVKVTIPSLFLKMFFLTVSLPHIKKDLCTGSCSQL